MSKLRGTKITGSWSDKQPHGREGKRCEVTSTGGASMRDVRECIKVCSSHWFDKDTMRFFKSRVGDKAYADGRGGAFFVSSEQGPHMARAYSVRHYSADRCGIDTVGEFMGYKTSAQATSAAKKLAVKGGGGLGRARLAGGGSREKFSRNAEVFSRGPGKPWFAYVMVDDRQHDLGPFATPEDAQKAARLAYRRLRKQR